MKKSTLGLRLCRADWRKGCAFPPQRARVLAKRGFGVGCRKAGGFPQVGAAEPRRSGHDFFTASRGEGGPLPALSPAGAGRVRGWLIPMRIFRCALHSAKLNRRWEKENQKAKGKCARHCAASIQTFISFWPRFPHTQYGIALMLTGSPVPARTGR